MMVQDGNLANFQTTAILAIVGQTVGIINMIYEQTKVDFFFLDWEKPRKVLAKDGKATAQISLFPHGQTCLRILNL